MTYLISILSIFGAFFYFGAFKASNYKSDALLLGFIVCIVFFIFCFTIQQLRENVEDQKNQIADLKRQIEGMKKTSTDNITNEDSKKDE